MVHSKSIHNFECITMKSMTVSQKKRVSDLIVEGMGLSPTTTIGFVASSLLADFPDFVLFSLLKSFPVDKQKQVK